MYRSYVGLFLIALISLVGCQTPTVFSPPTADWRSYQGQMHYSNAAGKSVVGEVVARRSPDGSEFQMQFSSGPGFPLLKLWQAGDNARAEGVFARGSWHGLSAKAPPALKNWVRVREVFAQLSPGRNDLRGPGWTATAGYGAGVPQRCDIAFAEGAERFDFQFSR
ncbi:MAG TPA: hypothetical protein VGO11_16445 [Chthoniobacteraceae bacterium]|jgi:hypothetical protein|nr:hypothetical protein [Chthoniobacteraceae bacterium]